MPDPNVKGIAALVKILTTRGELLKLLFPPAINTSGRWQGTYFSPGLLERAGWE